MTVQHATHTKKTGLGRTYQIEYTPVTYVIRLDGRILRSVSSAYTGTNTISADEMLIRAISAIDHFGPGEEE